MPRAGGTEREARVVMSQVTIEETNAFMAEAFTRNGPQGLVVDLALDYARVELAVSPANLRPGGFISGPTQMSMADTAAYVAVFTRIGITPMALTSNLSINFLRPCIGTVLVGEARMLKFGRASAVMTVDLFAREQEADGRTASHAVVTYMMPRDAP